MIKDTVEVVKLYICKFRFEIANIRIIWYYKLRDYYWKENLDLSVSQR